MREESNLQPAVDKIESLHTEPTSDNVLPQLISGQFVEDWQLFILQRIQPSLSLHISRDSLVHAIVTLVRDPRLSSSAMGFE